MRDITKQRSDKHGPDTLTRELTKEFRIMHRLWTTIAETLDDPRMTGRIVHWFTKRVTEHYQGEQDATPSTDSNGRIR